MPVPSEETPRPDADSLMVEQDRVLELMASGAALPESLDAIVRLIEHQLPGAATVMLAREDRLRLVAYSSRLSDTVAQQVDGIPIGEGSAVCGTAAARRRPVVVADLATDPLTAAWRDLVRQQGLASCWSIPIVAQDGEVLATFALYFRQQRVPGPQDQAIIDAAGRLTRIAIERDRSARAEQRSQALLRELAENSREVFYVRDARTGVILYVSPTYEKLWGRSAASLYRDPLSYVEGIHPDDRAAALAAHPPQQAGQSTTLEYRLLAADGAVRWIEDRTYPVLGPDGQVERLVGVAFDLTEKKNADLQLAAMNRALAMLSQCNEALALLDDEPALLNEVCRVAVQTGGYRMAWVGHVDESGEVQPAAHAGEEGGYLSEIRLSARRDDPTGMGPVATALRTGGVVVCSNIAASASFFWQDAALRRGYRSLISLPLLARDRIIGVLALYGAGTDPVAEEEVRLLQELAGNLALGIATFRARRERQRFQEELQRLNVELEHRVQQRTAQLAAANRELETFSYSLAHDLRGPLSAIDGFAQALHEAMAGRLQGRERHYLERVRLGAQSMAEMIDALLAMARLSREPLRWDPLDLSAIARAELQGLAEHEPTRELDCQVQEALVVHGDPRLIGLVMQNLLGNAWKFTAQRRPARIEVGRLAGLGGEPVFFVRDNGVGFDMAHAGKLFGAFQRLHAATEFPGTGLGLASCQRIVERHGGRIWAEAVPGQGACFFFTLGREAEARSFPSG